MKTHLLAAGLASTLVSILAASSLSAAEYARPKAYGAADVQKHAQSNKAAIEDWRVTFWEKNRFSSN